MTIANAICSEMLHIFSCYYYFKCTAVSHDGGILSAYKATATPLQMHILQEVHLAHIYLREDYAYLVDNKMTKEQQDMPFAALVQKDLMNLAKGLLA